ncbi:hypothetical protein ON010_g6974 [Phytophthora cinnamomi]|nr:hypothetical protein ON010_g6974 [Phytophthora cinnamomi]
MSVKVKQEWGKQRAVWSLEEEQVLMDLVDKARHDPDMRTKKGLRPRGWDAVAEEVNNRCKSAFNAGILKVYFFS